ncbi:DUF502 domain-containing protein [Thermodesulforhabdus norvegica]|uniref:Uncharacterized membrane protein n=1 Tax=Thermodesulforhabdus norvegica TaxID=39841 RepID=A0A1I4WFW8_9BACT|nr:DUF502 domain-containing protein [Thermodesulforhabdus norvegica]SFN12130.1 Uncharacterized membrane protein [Thermodesulforhabdus norvegica]
MKNFIKSLKDKIRNYFIAGILTVVPLSISVYVIVLILKNADRVFNIIPEKVNPKTYLPFPIPGLGIFIVVFGVFIVGVLVKNYVGGKIVAFGENIVYRIPLVRPLYSAVKQLLTAIFSQSNDTFRRVVLIEYPRKGIYAIAFVTGMPSGEVQEKTHQKVINVFLPTTPNPTSGFYLLVPESEVIPLTMTVEEAFKVIVSGGVVAPEPPRRDISFFRRPERNKELKATSTEGSIRPEPINSSQVREDK